jgi:DNA helicase HerA-like ATPase
MAPCSTGTGARSTTRPYDRPGRTRVAAWLDRTRPDHATLPVGELALAAGVKFELDAGGFGRHTFLCGQSGSGKTYSLGVLVERLLMETRLRVVVLDPNSDYVRLGQARPGADPRRARAVRGRGRLGGGPERGRRGEPDPGAVPGAQPGAAGSGAQARPARGPRGVRGADRADRGRGHAQRGRRRARCVRLDPAARAQPGRQPLGNLARAGGRLARRGAR